MYMSYFCGKNRFSNSVGTLEANPRDDDATFGFRSICWSTNIPWRQWRELVRPSPLASFVGRNNPEVCGIALQDSGATRLEKPQLRNGGQNLYRMKSSCHMSRQETCKGWTSVFRNCTNMREAMGLNINWLGFWGFWRFRLLRYPKRRWLLVDSFVPELSK